MRELRILCVHGVGRHPVGGAWEQDWAGAIHSALGGAAPDISPVIEYVHYDDIFAGHKIGFFDALEAFGKLVGNAVGSIFRGAPRGATARGGSGSLRWTAGMVVQWVENDDLRRQTRRRMRDRIRSVDPHLICAHSLGSLISYDAFTDDGADLVDDRTLLTFGSQIGNPFVAGSFLGGRIVPLATAKQWTHLYNEEDDVFAAPIRLHADNFEQIDTFFDLPGVADHSAVEYLEHPHAVADFWHDFAFTATERRRLRARPVRANLRWAAPPKKRALLVGINDYPDDSMRLAGCVNDVYLMSALLQETGYAPEDIRVVLDDRATADGIRTRLDWLLDRAGPGHERVLYYSGHG
ncbi:MAG: caspase family protein, partial [Planctomycetota bacterium]|nr:caspase family protein [Planctomycetota bacterium]